MIFNAAKSSRADLLIMGSRGRSKASAMLMGSVADGLVRINREIPLLVVKNKNENLDFFDALLKL
jgi:nucleotide-binding universal stress UspA family protein